MSKAGRTDVLKINEVFGPTLQGEGPYTGRPCAFVRFAECGLTCFFCDTAYTWSFSEAKAAKHRDRQVYNREDEVHRMSIQQVREQVCCHAHLGDIVVLSGGEPLLYTGRATNPNRPDYLAELTETLYNAGFSSHVETAGVLTPTARLIRAVDHFTVSPKLQSSGNSLSMRYKPEVLDRFVEINERDATVAFKYVVCNSEDLDEVDVQVRAHEIPAHQVWLMPQGTTRNELLNAHEWLAKEAIDRGYCFSTRLHVLIWDDKRGV